MFHYKKFEKLIKLIAKSERKSFLLILLAFIFEHLIINLKKITLHLYTATHQYRNADLVPPTYTKKGKIRN